MNTCSCNTPDPSGTLNGGVEVCLSCGDTFEAKEEESPVRTDHTHDPRHPLPEARADADR